MIYEFRTYDIRPGFLAVFERRYSELYLEKPRKYSELFAFWHAEIGPLNQVIHAWPYKDMEERARIREAAMKEKAWPPAIGEFIASQRTDIFVPAPFSPKVAPGKLGPYFEMRTYTYTPGALPNILENWGKAIPDRLKYSSPCFLGHSELGGLNKWVHIWPYASLDQRMSVRKQALDARVWPPPVVAEREGRKCIPFVAQENKILMPASFSPIQ